MRQRIKKIRELHCFTQLELAEKLCVSRLQIVLIENEKRAVSAIVAAMAESVLGVSRHWLIDGTGLMYVDTVRGINMIRQRGRLLDTDDLYYLLQLINIAWSHPIAVDMNTRSQYVTNMLDVLEKWMDERPYPSLANLSSIAGYYGSYEDVINMVRTHIKKIDAVSCSLAAQTSAILVQYVRDFAMFGGLTSSQLNFAIETVEAWIYSVALCADHTRERIYMSSTELPLHQIPKKTPAKIEIREGDVYLLVYIENNKFMGTLHIRNKLTILLDTRFYVEIIQGKRLHHDNISFWTMNVSSVSIILSEKEYKELSSIYDRVREDGHYGMVIGMYVQEYGYL